MNRTAPVRGSTWGFPKPVVLNSGGVIRETSPTVCWCLLVGCPLGPAWLEPPDELLLLLDPARAKSLLLELSSFVDGPEYV